MKKAETEVFPLRASSARKALSIAEVLVGVFMIAGIFAVLLLVLNSGYISQALTTATVDLQEDARRAMDWMVKDLRQTTIAEIKANSPSSSHLKFRTYTGYSGGSPVWSGSYIEYTYVPGASKLVRDNGTTSLEFHNITSVPFGIDAAWISGNDNKISINLNTSKTARGNINVTYNLSTEVRVRNE